MKRNVTLGVIIIFIGVIWLLNNLNIFPFSFGAFLLALRSLWPLLLIGIGFSIVFRANVMVRFIIWIIILLAIFLYGLFGMDYGPREYNYDLPGNYTENHNYNLSMREDTEEGRLNLSLGAGEFRIASNNEELVKLRSNIPDLQYEHKFQDNDRKVFFDVTKEEYVFNLKSDNMHCFLDLHKDVLWEMNLKFGAAKTDLDFSELKISKLDLEAGAADLKLTLSDRSEYGEIDINTGASNLDIYVPKEAGLRIKMESALSNDNIDKLNLVSKDGYLQSQDYDTKTNKYKLTIKMGVGNLNFHSI